MVLLLVLQYGFQIYLKNIPTEMLCGEVKEVPVLLQNVGTLPIQRVFFTSSEPSLFSVPQCKVGSKVFPLQCQPIEPGHSIEVTIFLRGCDKSGRISIDLLFYYDAEKSSPQKLKYRLLYHTMHLLVHESLYSSVVASRSMLINDDAKEVINIQIQVQNKNQVSIVPFCSGITRVSISREEVNVDHNRRIIMF